MHYVKEEIGDGKGVFECKHEMRLKHVTPTSLALKAYSSFLSSASPDTISLQQALHESVFSPGISASPPHRVALCWDKHCQLLPEVLGLTAKRVATWSSEEVRHAYTLTLLQHMKNRRSLILKGCCCSGKLQEFSMRVFFWLLLLCIFA